MKTNENKTILKKQLCNDLIENGKVNEGDIVKHSFTNQIMSGKKKSVEKSNEMIALTTRGDTVGVCVKVDRDERERERESVVLYEFANSRQKSVCDLWDLPMMTTKL